jgi:hypothetical protein
MKKLKKVNEIIVAYWAALVWENIKQQARARTEKVYLETKKS